MPQHKTIYIEEGVEVFHIYPIQGVYINGVSAAEQDVTEDEWLRLNEYKPPAFVCDPLPSVEDTTPEKEGI